jgi:hypothetical protein
LDPIYAASEPLIPPLVGGGFDISGFNRISVSAFSFGWKEVHREWSRRWVGRNAEGGKAGAAMRVILRACKQVPLAPEV